MNTSYSKGHKQTLLLFMRTVLKLTAADEQKRNVITSAFTRFANNISYFHADEDLELVAFLDFDEIIEFAPDADDGFRISGEAMRIAEMVPDLKSNGHAIIEQIQAGSAKDAATAYGYHVITKEIIDDLITIRRFFESLYTVLSAYVSMEMRVAKLVIQPVIEDAFSMIELEIDDIIMAACKAREINQSSELVSKMLRNTKIDPQTIDVKAIFREEFSASSYIVDDIALIRSKMPEYRDVSMVTERPYMRCALTGKLMTNPVVASDSRIYEFDDIRQFFIDQLEAGFVTMDVSTSSNEAPEHSQLMPNPRRDGYIQNTSVVTVPDLDIKIKSIGVPYHEYSDKIFYH